MSRFTRRSRPLFLSRARERRRHRVQWLCPPASCATCLACVKFTMCRRTVTWRWSITRFLEIPPDCCVCGEWRQRAYTHPPLKPQRWPAGANEVTIDNFAFNPKIVTIAAGSKLTWRNRDDVPHKIQSANNRFAGSPLLDTKATYSVGFAEGGEFPYFCSLHPVMQGKVVVTR